jgi:nucleoside-diphosphate-sugar epimerase
MLVGRPRILVTGALGHIGSALIRNETLQQRECHFILVDDLSTQRFPSLFNLPSGASYDFVEGDVEDALTSSLVSDVDAVVHLAAMTDPTASVEEPQRVFGNNLRITRHVAAKCAELRVPMVFTSSTSVYSGRERIARETTTSLDPQSPYARCKLDEEAAITSLVHRGLRAAIFRLGTVFGIAPGMRFHTAVNRFCWQAATGQPLQVWATAMNQRRPYLAVSDASNALARTVVEHIYPGIPINAVTCNATVDDVIKAILAFGCSVDVTTVQSPLMNDRSYEVCTDRARQLGFTFDGELENEVASTLRLLGGLTRTTP